LLWQNGKGDTVDAILDCTGELMVMASFRIEVPFDPAVNPVP
jgi:hypothetical protein